MKVLVIVADGLHLGAVGCYGSDWIETPTLDRLAAEGVVFDRHYADRPDAEGARRSWRTGRYDFPIPAGPGAAAAEPADLLHRLRNGSATTFLIQDALRPTPDFFSAGWDHAVRLNADRVENVFDALRPAVVASLERLASFDHWLLWLDLTLLLPPWKFLETLPEHDSHETDEKKPGADAETIEEREEPLPFLTHSPRGPLEDAGDVLFPRLRRTYAAAVSFVDAGLADLLNELAKRTVYEELTILFTSGQGAVLGEHGIVGAYRPWLHEELIHVPLIVRLPGGAEAGRHVPALTQALDLMPTLLELFQLPPAPVDGHSLLPLTTGRCETVRPFACAGLQIDRAIEWALRTPEWAFLLPVAAEAGDLPRRPRLYVKPDDRWEVNDVVQQYWEQAEHLEQVLRGFVERCTLR